MEQRCATLKEKCKTILSSPILGYVKQGKHCPELKDIFSNSKITESQLKDRLVALLDPVRRCHSELDKFTRDTQDNRCPFLEEVVRGDAYGVSGENGLDELIHEISVIEKIVKNAQTFSDYILDE